MGRREMAQAEGGVKARFLVPALELLESGKILCQPLTRMPRGDSYVGNGKFNFVSGTAFSRVEASRGEVM